MDKVRLEAVLAALETVESQEQEQQLHTDPEEAGQENVSHWKEVLGVILCEAAGPSRLNVMMNPILMDKIANYLSDKDLVALCLASKTTKKIIDRMDSSCWGKRAKLLEAVLRLEATDWTRTSSKERFLILKPEVDRLSLAIRGKIEDNLGVIQLHGSVDEARESKFMSQQELASASSLVHHGMLGEVNCRALKLWNVIMDLSSIPPQQLGSLAACVRDHVCIGRDVTIPDLGVLLDTVKSEYIFIDKTLGTEDTLALVRAMQTRVKRVILLIMSKSVAVDIVMALKTYDGKGRCEEIRLVLSLRLRDSIEETNGRTENIRKWAQTIGWDVTEDRVTLLYSSVIKIERRQHQQ